MSHGQCAIVENLRIADQILMQILLAQHHICTGIPVEREVSVAVREGLYECQSCSCIFVNDQVGSVDANLIQGCF